MRVLIDTNILLDVFFEREPHAQASAKVWQACEDGDCEGFIAPLTTVNIYYIAQKQIGAAKARNLVRETLGVFQVTPLSILELDTALELPITDYEDAVQVACASSMRLDAIITRNQGDFQGSPVVVYSPVEFLKALRQ